jgi:hypothetical protein
LDAETTYYFKIYPYTNSSTAIDYKTDGTVPSANATTEAKPPIPNLMLSEIADPSDSPNAKFVELYNYSGSTIDFSTGNWYLCRQANGDPGSWGDVQLIGSISSGSTYIVAYNKSTFEATFGISADLYSGFISGNGDDGYFLYYGGDHSSGELVDAYGVIDQDGSGKPWEYEDCHAVRNAGVTEPNSTWTASEWTIESATAAQCTPGVSTLPVTLSTFTASFQNNVPSLYWRTESETDNIAWYIYRNAENDFDHATKINPEPIPGYGTTSAPHSYVYEDYIENPTPGDSYWYWLTSVDIGGMIHYYDKVAQLNITETEPEPDTPEKPEMFGLFQNIPNPFNPGSTDNTTIKFNLPNHAKVQINIYNIKGELVRSIYNGFSTSGSATWDGKDEHGKLQSNGIYLYELRVNDKLHSTKRLILLK